MAAVDHGAAVQSAWLAAAGGTARGVDRGAAVDGDARALQAPRQGAARPGVVPVAAADALEPAVHLASLRARGQRVPRQPGRDGSLGRGAAVHRLRQGRVRAMSRDVHASDRRLALGRRGSEHADACSRRTRADAVPRAAQRRGAGVRHGAGGAEQAPTRGVASARRRRPRRAEAVQEAHQAHGARARLVADRHSPLEAGSDRESRAYAHSLQALRRQRARVPPDAVADLQRPRAVAHAAAALGRAALAGVDERLSARADGRARAPDIAPRRGRAADRDRRDAGRRVASGRACAAELQVREHHTVPQARGHVPDRRQVGVLLYGRRAPAGGGAPSHAQVTPQARGGRARAQAASVAAESRAGTAVRGDSGGAQAPPHAQVQCTRDLPHLRKALLVCIRITS